MSSSFFLYCYHILDIIGLKGCVIVCYVITLTNFTRAAHFCIAIVVCLYEFSEILTYPKPGGLTRNPRKSVAPPANMRCRT